MVYVRVYVGLGTCPWACVKRKISYNPWKGWHQVVIVIKIAVCKFKWSITKRSSAWSLTSIWCQWTCEDVPKSGSPIVEYGEQSSSRHRPNAIKKGGPSWGSQDHHHLAQEDEVQGIGLPLIGFLVRIDCCSIKEGSQVSSLIVSFVESSNHLHPCIILLGS